MRNISYYLARKWHKSSLKAQFLSCSLSKTSFTHRMPPCWICPLARHSYREPWVSGFHPPRSVTCICFCREILPLLWSICFCCEVFAFAVKYLLLSWGICFCREVFAFAVKYLLLSWGICFCREVFAFAVRVLVLPWQFWAIVGVSNLTKSNHLNLPKMSSIFPKYSLVGEFSWHPWISVVRAKSAVYSKELLFTSS